LFSKEDRVHFIGIGGIGVSAVARVLIEQGIPVTGSDVRESQITLELESMGATVNIGHAPENVASVDLVVHSTAIPETNCELIEAKKNGTRIVHRSEVLGAIVAQHTLSIGVVGTHGKGTVASALTWILESAGKKPTFIIGGLLENLNKKNARYVDGQIAVAEVDESDGSLRNVHPHIVVINNLEADHLNYYDSLEHIQDTVIAALDANPRLEHVIINADSPGAIALAPRVKANVLTFGREQAADVRCIDVSCAPMESKLTIEKNGQLLGTTMMGQPGLYNADNAIAATAAATVLGVPFDTIAGALGSFRGLENRFTVLEIGDRRVIKDYISHPTGIRRVLAAAKADGRPITAVFKPYRFTMINYLQEDYAEAFHDADHTIITELYTAGEVPIPGIDTEFLCNKIRERGPKVTFVQEMDGIVSLLHDVAAINEQVVFFGGDDLFRLADRYAGELRERSL
jgi:UDP-N-acetylmuramate--alanine ligase